jgi:FkbM family methyltransferase
MKLNTTILFAILLRRLRPDLVCDVGALDGLHARRFRSLAPDARVVAFEANPEHIRAMREDQRNRDARIEVYHKVVSNCDGSIAFYLEHSRGHGSDGGRRGISSTRRRIAESAGATTVEVDALRLDTFVREVAPAVRRIALWIDAEGSGFEVLEGMAGIHERVSLVHVEVEAREFWEGQQLAPVVRRLMTQWSFVEVGRGRARWQHDLVFVSADALAQAQGAVKLAAVVAALAAWVEPVLPKRWMLEKGWLSWGIDE